MKQIQQRKKLFTHDAALQKHILRIFCHKLIKINILSHIVRDFLCNLD